MTYLDVGLKLEVEPKADTTIRFWLVFQRTSKLSKAQMAELIDFIQAWDAQT